MALLIPTGNFQVVNSTIESLYVKYTSLGPSPVISGNNYTDNTANGAMEVTGTIFSDTTWYDDVKISTIP